MNGARRLSAAALLALLPALAASCGGPRQPPNLLLITVDTLRPDRLGHGGNPRPVSPVLDRLAAAAVRFERSYSQAGWTLPSVATILTGRHPAAHGAERVGRKIDAALPTLAELLAAHGYEAHAVVSHALLRASYGLGRGFVTYDESVLDVGHPHKVATAEPLTELALEAMGSATAPFFLWVHYFDPHFAYLSHPEWAGFGSSPLDRYDGEIAHTDRQIGRLLEALEARGAGGDTVVVVTSDHGEAFSPRARFHYGVYESVLRTPLLIRAPGLAPGSRDQVAQQIDLLPTILGLLGLPAPEGLPGRDLLAAAAGAPAVYVERLRPRPYRQRVLIRGRFKLALVEAEPEAADAEPPGGRNVTRVRPGIFLYDLEADPGEERNLWDPEDPRAQRLLAELVDHGTAPAAAGEEVAVSDELRERLNALGYLD